MWFNHHLRQLKEHTDGELNMNGYNWQIVFEWWFCRGLSTFPWYIGDAPKPWSGEWLWSELGARYKSNRARLENSPRIVELNGRMTGTGNPHRFLTKELLSEGWLKQPSMVWVTWTLCHWIGWREHLHRKPWVFPIKYGQISCKLSLQPIQWVCKTRSNYPMMISLKLWLPYGNLTQLWNITILNR